MSKVCYTAIFGDIDNLHEPTVITKGWEYVCFTDRDDIYSDVYDINVVKNPHNVPYDKRAVNRFCKMQEFNKKDVKVYHDGCFRVNCNLDELSNNLMVKHPFHDCAYDEVKLCEERRKFNYIKRNELEVKLNELKVERKSGMYCGGLFKFTNPNIDFFNEWYSYQLYSVRDQWILPYLLKKHNIQFDSITWQQAIKLFTWEKHVK